MTTNYFQNCNTKEERKARFVALAKQHHPDKGGDVKIMQEINRQYAQVSSYDSRSEEVEPKQSFYKRTGTNPYERSERNQENRRHYQSYSRQWGKTENINARFEEIMRHKQNRFDTEIRTLKYVHKQQMERKDEEIKMYKNIIKDLNEIISKKPSKVSKVLHNLVFLLWWGTVFYIILK